jgi:hypothetical protein
LPWQPTPCGPTRTRWWKGRNLPDHVRGRGDLLHRVQPN